MSSLVETPQGYLLTPYDPQVEEQLKIGRKIMRKYRHTLGAPVK